MSESIELVENLETQTTTAGTITPLNLDLDDAKKTAQAPVIQDEETKQLDSQADSVVKQLLNMPVTDINQSQMAKTAIESFGNQAIQQSALASDLLKKPLKDISKRSDDGGEVANSLIDLKMAVEEADPVHLSAGWFSHLLGKLPFVGSPVKRYVTRYENASTVIEAIKVSLLNGKAQLERDTVTLQGDQVKMREATLRLEKAIKLGQLISDRLAGEIANIIEPDKKRFLQEEILLPIRQRVVDLQTQLAVNQQGFMAMELLIRNNKELIKGVDRTIQTTIKALHIGATLAIGLQDQKAVLDKVKEVKSVGENLILNNARMLKEQGVEIQKQASETMLSLETFKTAFGDIKQAINDISRYRQDALPKLANTIIELDSMTKEQENVIKDMENGRNMSSTFHLDV